jgi:hypothetical protein
MSGPYLQFDPQSRSHYSHFDRSIISLLRIPQSVQDSLRSSLVNLELKFPRAGKQPALFIQLLLHPTQSRTGASASREADRQGLSYCFVGFLIVEQLSTWEAGIGSLRSQPLIQQRRLSSQIDAIGRKTHALLKNRLSQRCLSNARISKRRPARRTKLRFYPSLKLA